MVCQPLFSSARTSSSAFRQNMGIRMANPREVNLNPPRNKQIWIWRLSNVQPTPMDPRLPLRVTLLKHVHLSCKLPTRCKICPLKRQRRCQMRTSWLRNESLRVRVSINPRLIPLSGLLLSMMADPLIVQIPPLVIPPMCPQTHELPRKVMHTVAR